MIKIPNKKVEGWALPEMPGGSVFRSDFHLFCYSCSVIDLTRILPLYLVLPQLVHCSSVHNFKHTFFCRISITFSSDNGTCEQISCNKRMSQIIKQLEV